MEELEDQSNVVFAGLLLESVGKEGGSETPPPRPITYLHKNSPSYTVDVVSLGGIL